MSSPALKLLIDGVRIVPRRRVWRQDDRETPERTSSSSTTAATRCSEEKSSSAADDLQRRPASREFDRGDVGDLARQSDRRAPHRRSTSQLRQVVPRGGGNLIRGGRPFLLAVAPGSCTL